MRTASLAQLVLILGAPVCFASAFLAPPGAPCSFFSAQRRQVGLRPRVAHAHDDDLMVPRRSFRSGTSARGTATLISVGDLRPPVIVHVPCKEVRDLLCDPIAVVDG